MVGSDPLLCTVTEVQKEFQVIRKGLQLDIRTLLSFWLSGYRNFKRPKTMKRFYKSLPLETFPP